ncbi:MAG TPA: hypothetical protein VN914_19330 [Polyangia bacterium]|nr:hypothetical protein [Polyangia bacterium]
MRAALLIALAASGCAMSVSGELPEIEVTQHDLALPGAPRELRTGDVTVSLPSFFQPNERIGLPIDSYQSVKVTGMTVVLKKGGGGDLSFLRALRVTLGGLQGFVAGAAPIEVAKYERPASGTAGSSIEAGKGAVEVVEAWRDPVTVMTVEATGDLPEEAWTVDVVVRLSALLRY